MRFMEMTDFSVLIRWQESVQVSEALVRALREAVLGAGGGELPLNFYAGCVPKVPGLGWVLKLQVWRQERSAENPLSQAQKDLGGGWDFGLGPDGKLVSKDGIETPTVFCREREFGAYLGDDLWRACEREFVGWLVLLRQLIGRERGVAESKILLGR